MSEVKISQLPESTTVDNTVYIPIVQGTGTDTDNYKMKPSNAITKTDITTKLGAASASNDGYLSAAGWSLFNGKLDYRTFGSAANNNTGDFYATGSTVANSTSWSGAGEYLGSTVSVNSYLMGYGADSKWHPIQASAVQSFIGLGSSAYTNTNDHILNQNASAQPGYMWISGSAKIDGGLALINRYDNSSNGSIIYNSGAGADFIFAESAPNIYTFGSGGYGSIVAPTLSLNISTRAATFASTVNSTGFLLNGNNLTSSLSNNYIPKWNGSSMVNSLISDLSDRVISSNNIILNNSSIDQTTNKSVGALVGQARNYSQNNQSGIASIHFVTDPTYFYKGGISFRTNNVDGTDINNPPIERMFIDKIGDIKILSTTPSTLPTNGALVVNGGIGVGGNATIGGNLMIFNSTPYTSFYQAGVQEWKVGQLSSGSNAFTFYANGQASPNVLSLFGNGNTTIGYTTDQGYKLAVNGSGYFNGNVTTNQGTSGSAFSATNSAGGYCNIGVTSNAASEGYINFTSLLRLTGANVLCSGTVTASNFIGPLTGNADTTTILQTTRTIWGQNFNGSGNVSGALSGASTINASGTITGGSIVRTSGTSTQSLQADGTTLDYKCQSLSGTSITFNAAGGLSGNLTLAGNTTIYFFGLQAGMSGNFFITNPSSVLTITFANHPTIIQPIIKSGTDQVTCSGSGLKDCFSWAFDGTSIWINGTKGYSA